MTPPSIHRIERFNYGIGAVLTLLAVITQSRPIALGIAVGVALTCLNFFVLRKLVVKWTRDAKAGKTGASPLLIMPKMIGLMLAVVGALALLPIDAIAFTVGYSIFILSIMAETLYSAFRHQETE
ncbi:MAG TPA: ATP synthase subunit I [Kofleriaceae bacterium]